MKWTVTELFVRCRPTQLCRDVKRRQRYRGPMKWTITELRVGYRPTQLCRDVTTHKDVT